MPSLHPMILDGQDQFKIAVFSGILIFGAITKNTLNLMSTLLLTKVLR